jgi:hypothetical protein|mmetsp:Transcript_96320/g.150594  ORF Transcript_96320/g.150594 Transcript_96320/m.150594 type:complete len:552 (-) Transcript_96320:226-1881(-)|eukprot:CAMPEP_0169103714 /NCGR_PEP_ID=MMETSP1015-20121227/22865_1 /TAXON_ID=342587 /ORGANISM="Karlodinium micrum, Strain CCMP2283" /LENGTH=551 /DNA_ID=CAMNT_0009164935 /DNA_START=80 /DNA_END=1735 /DNA_ORIENTATION=-
MTHTLLGCIVIAAFAATGFANEFLKAAPKELIERVSEEDIQTSLLEEVEGTLGTGSAAHRLRLLEAVLKPMYDALPKNEHGNLGHSVVRYALHRLFVLRHGWNIKGLGRNSEESNITSPAGILKDHVPTYIQNIFEKRLGDKGLGLHDLAVMASTLEHLIHKEAVTRLGQVYKVFKTFPTKKVSVRVANEMLDTYMMAHILGENLTNLTLFDARSLNADMPQLFLGWRDTQKFVRRIRGNITQGSDGVSPSLDFSSLAKVVKAVGEEFGSFQDMECHALKDKLTDMEFAGSGRVKLSDFYRPSLDGAWHFEESVPYLRQLGALDESDPNAMSVIIVNYLHSQTNCIASSGYYSVCCKDECEGLFGKLEEKLQAPEAKPAAIVDVVENMLSSTVKSPRTFSPKMLKYLDDIANLHQGSVPLHGRLFAQWMHHAYPRECPYPHKAGTTRQQTGDEWFLESGLEFLATEREMNEFTKSSAGFSIESDEGIMPWSAEEELLVCRETPTAASVSLFARLRPAVLFILASLLAYGLVQNFKSTSVTGKDKSHAKYIV